MKTTVYQELENKALPFIKAYHNDLIKYDRGELDRCPGVPFLHFTGDTGTYLEMMPEHDHKDYPAPDVRVPYLFGMADRWHILRGKVTVVVDCVGRNNRTDLILYYNGITLRAITLERAKDIIREYETSISWHWKNQKGY